MNFSQGAQSQLAIVANYSISTIDNYADNLDTGKMARREPLEFRFIRVG